MKNYLLIFINFIIFEPMTAASAIAATISTCFGVLKPNPKANGTAIWRRTTAINETYFV